MSSSYVGSTSNSSYTSGTTGSSSSQSFFEALAQAWGNALNAEEQTIQNLSNELNASGSSDSSNAGITTQLTAESQQFNFLANSESTAINAVGDALQTVARKQ